MFSVMTEGPYGDSKIEKLVVEMNRFYDSYDAAIAEIEKMEKTVNDIPSISKQEIKGKVDAFKDSFRYWVELRELLKTSEELVLRVFYVIGSDDADACKEEFYKCREEWIELAKKFPEEEKVPSEKTGRKLYYDFWDSITKGHDEVNISQYCSTKQEILFAELDLHMRHIFDYIHDVTSNLNYLKYVYYDF